MTEFQLALFLCCTGLLWHFAMKWNEARMLARNDHLPLPSILDFIKDTPAQSTISVLATIVAFTLTHAMGWMNPGMAVACGYMGNSVAENAVKQFAKKYDNVV